MFCRCRKDTEHERFHLSSFYPLDGVYVDLSVINLTLETKEFQRIVGPQLAGIFPCESRASTGNNHQVWLNS